MYVGIEGTRYRVDTGFISLRIGKNVDLFWTRQWTFEFHKRQMISWLSERQSASWKELRVSDQQQYQLVHWFGCHCSSGFKFKILKVMNLGMQVVAADVSKSCNILNPRCEEQKVALVPNGYGRTRSVTGLLWCSFSTHWYYRTFRSPSSGVRALLLARWTKFANFTAVSSVTATAL
jgi:hypothetical protein